MRYTVSIDINAPLDEVITRFDDPEKMKEWMTGLVSFETIEGEPGQVGAKSKLVFKMGKRDMEMIETITERNLPERFAGYYEVKGDYNEVGNGVEAVGENITRYTSDKFFMFEDPQDAATTAIKAAIAVRAKNLFIVVCFKVFN